MPPQLSNIKTMSLLIVTSLHHRKTPQSLSYPL
jgi:hypothetical protein